MRRRTGWRRTSLAALAALLTTIVGVVSTSAPSASAATSYKVTLTANTEYGNSVSYTLNIVPEPAGSITGTSSCNYVRPAGSTGSYVPTASNWKTLPPGNYQLAQCYPSSVNPLKVDGVPVAVSSFGIGTIRPKNAVLVGGVDVGGTSDAPTVQFTADLYNEFDSIFYLVAGEKVTASFQDDHSIWHEGFCEFTTTDAGDPGSCQLPADEAKVFKAGTGMWRIDHPVSLYASDSTSGIYPGAATSLEQAAINFSTDAQTIDVVATELPPSCHPEGVNASGVSLISTSLGTMNCSQLHLTQILAGAIPAAVTLVTLGGIGVANLIQIYEIAQVAGQVAANAAIAATRTAVANALRGAVWVVGGGVI